MTFRMRVAVLSLFTTLFFAVAQFFPLSLYSVTSLTTLTKRTLSDYTPAILFSSSGQEQAIISALDDDDGSATYLPDIIQAATNQCRSTCHVVSRTLAGCLRSGADYDILECSCSDTTLARVFTCANCITIDATNPNGTLPLQNYNAFVNQCISLGLSNSSQLYQIRGEPLTIAHATTTLTNPSATVARPSLMSAATQGSTSAAVAADENEDGDVEFDEQDEEALMLDETSSAGPALSRMTRTVLLVSAVTSSLLLGFTPKEDIAGNAPMKSSLQRQIRSKILDQYPFLSQPASLPVLAQSGTGSVDDHHSDDEDDNNNEDLSSSRRRKGAGKDKKSKKEAGGGKKSGGNNNNSGGKKGQQQAEQVEDATAEDKPTDEEVLTVMDTLWPKKEGCSLVKCRDHVSMYTVHGEPLFFQHFDGPFYPTLKVLHKYPGMLPRVGVDRGAIKFVLGGANIMCPGMTSATGYLPPTEHNIAKSTPVAVHAYGKENALAIGLTAMSTDEIRSINKNIGVDMIHFLGDDLWKVDRL
ncbi:hypothetical protein JCM3766R1_002465 [Sporobolomyces carnicolor]